MPEPLESIRNIGPAMAADLKAAGIETADHLRDLGADAAYQALINAGTRPHFIAYYAMAMGLQGRPWNDCKGKEKADLRKRYDALLTAARPTDTALARALDELGIRVDTPLLPDTRAQKRKASTKRRP